MWIHGLRSGPPASSSSTRYLPLSLSRPATAQPAEPAPVTIKSKVSAAPATIFSRGRILHRSTLTKPIRGGKCGGPRLFGFVDLCRLHQLAIGCRQDDGIEEHLRVFADRLCSADDRLPHLRLGVAG